MWKPRMVFPSFNTTRDQVADDCRWQNNKISLFQCTNKNNESKSD